MFAVLVAALVVPQVAAAHTLPMRTAKKVTNLVSQGAAERLNADGYDADWGSASDCDRDSRHRVTCLGHVSASAYDSYVGEVSLDCSFPVTTWVGSRSYRLRVSAAADAMECYDQDGRLVTKRAARTALRRAVPAVLH